MSSTVHLLVHTFIFQYTRMDCDEFDIGDLYRSCYEVNSGSCLSTVVPPLHEAEEFYQSSKKLHIVQRIVLE